MTTRQDYGSQIITALESAWIAIRDQHPEVPHVVLITGTGREARYITWGHFGADRWQPGEDGTPRVPELFAGGELIGLGGRRVMQTLLHEAAHALAHVRDVKDTSSAGRYHNRRFVALAGELGLAGPERPASVIGWSDCTITDQTAQRYHAAIHALDAARLPHLPGAAAEYDQEPIPAPRRGSRAGRRLAVVCACEPPRRIQISPAALEAGPLLCGICRADFSPADAG